MLSMNVRGSCQPRGMTTSPAVIALIAGAALIVGVIVGWTLASRRTPVLPDVAEAIAPIRANLDALAAQVQRGEREQAKSTSELRAELTTALDHQVRAVVRSTESVRAEAARLTSVLGRSGARGRWGEMQLRRLCEAAGLLDRVHFVEQSVHVIDERSVRPDLIVTLANDQSIVVDAKVPLAAYLEADAATEDAQVAAFMAQHATDVVRHIDTLHSRDYQRAVPGDAQFVVMFLPAESLLQAALEQRPDLLDYAFARGIIPATPTTLFAMLRTVAVSWRQHSLADHAQQIADIGGELHARLVTWTSHLTKLGASLDSAVAHYNKAVGSLESRVLVSARQFRDLGATEADLMRPEPITQTTRSPVTAELLEHAG